MSSDSIRRQMGVSSGPQGAPEEDGGLPWLEPAPDPDRGSLSFKSLAIIGTIFLLVFIALMAVFYNRIAGSGPEGSGIGGGSPTLIAAPPGPFKITPEQDSRSELAYNEDSGNNSAPRFSGGSERPLSGAEQLEQAAKGDGPAAVSLGNKDEPVLGYVRTAKKPDAEPSATAPITQPKIEKTPAVTKPAPAKVVEEVKKAVPSTPAPVETASAGGYMLQLGAFSSRDSAMNGWRQFSDKYPGSLSGLAPDIQSFQNSSGRNLYRLRASGLSSRARADARCAALKAAKQACFVVSPQ